MDIDINGEPAGRLRFTLRPDLAPKTVENFMKLSDGSAVGVNPSLTYKAERGTSRFYYYYYYYYIYFFTFTFNRLFHLVSGPSVHAITCMKP